LGEAHHYFCSILYIMLQVHYLLLWLQDDLCPPEISTSIPPVRNIIIKV
jgi:hypothetical protein